MSQEVRTHRALQGAQGSGLRAGGQSWLRLQHSGPQCGIPAAAPLVHGLGRSFQACRRINGAGQAPPLGRGPECLADSCMRRGLQPQGHTSSHLYYEGILLARRSALPGHLQEEDRGPSAVISLRLGREEAMGCSWTLAVLQYLRLQPQGAVPALLCVTTEVAPGQLLWWHHLVCFPGVAIFLREPRGNPHHITISFGEGKGSGESPSPKVT